MAALATDWLRHFLLLLWNCWTEFKETWYEARSQTSSTKFVFFGPMGKQDVCPGLWFAVIFFRLFLWNRLNRIQQTWQVARSQCPLPSLCFRADQEKQNGCLASDWLRHFRLLLLNGWTEFNVTDREQELNVLYQFCVFLVDLKNKMAAIATDWLSHFRLFLWNRWMEFIETW